MHACERAFVMHTLMCVSALSCQIDDVMLKPPDRRCVCSHISAGVLLYTPVLCGIQCNT